MTTKSQPTPLKQTKNLTKCLLILVRGNSNQKVNCRGVPNFDISCFRGCWKSLPSRSSKFLNLLQNYLINLESF